MRKRMCLFGWITAVVSPLTELSVLLTGHDVAEATMAAGVAGVVATEIAVRLFGRGDNDTMPPTGGVVFVQA
jgi:hypothetical protein